LCDFSLFLSPLLLLSSFSFSILSLQPIPHDIHNLQQTIPWIAKLS
jgi:hypothetical protein